LYSRKTDYYNYITPTVPTTNPITGAPTTSQSPGFSQVTEGVTGTIGQTLAPFTRLFSGYAYEVINIAVFNTTGTTSATTPTTTTTGASTTTGTSATSATSTSTTSTASTVPLFNLGVAAGLHIESRVSSSFVHDTVDNPMTPHRGVRITETGVVAGGFLGGTVDYLKPETEIILYIPHTHRTSLGLRGQVGWLRPYGNTTKLPYYLRYFLGGEYQIRGVDIRTVGPIDSQRNELGGNKFVLFNAEYYVDIFGPVRAILFHDAGQAFLEGQNIDLRQLRTSSGAELRVMVPVMNVPFRLIYAWNVYRDVFQPKHAVKFSVGTTF
jgi:outer membrane protein assembly factor BamA